MSDSKSGPSSEPTGSPTGQSARPAQTGAVTPADSVPTPADSRESGKEPRKQPGKHSGKGPDQGAGKSTGKGDKDPLRGSRTSGLWIALTAVGVLIVLLVVFTLQNTQEVDIAFLGWEGRAPLSAAILIAAAAGILITAIAGSLRILQLRRRVRHQR